MALVLPTVTPMQAFHLEVGDTKKASRESSRGARSFQDSCGSGVLEMPSHLSTGRGGQRPARQGGAVGLSELPSGGVWTVHLAVEPPNLIPWPSQNFYELLAIFQENPFLNDLE